MLGKKALKTIAFGSFGLNSNIHTKPGKFLYLKYYEVSAFCVLLLFFFQQILFGEIVYVGGEKNCTQITNEKYQFVENLF